MEQWYALDETISATSHDALPRIAHRGLIMKPEEALVTSTLNSWKNWIERADKSFSLLTEGQMQKEVAPGKNRLIYLVGHLTAVHDRMLPLLELGPRLHPELDAPFISNPDRATAELPQPKRSRSHGRRSTANCLQDLKNSHQPSGCKNTPRFPRKTLPKIRRAIALLSCKAAPVTWRFIWGRLH